MSHESVGVCHCIVTTVRYTTCMNKTNQDSQGENKMETVIKIEKTQTGFAHWVRLASGLVVIEFVTGA